MLVYHYNSVQYIYISIYIYREREIEREKERGVRNREILEIYVYINQNLFKDICYFVFFLQFLKIGIAINIYKYCKQL